MRYDDGPAIRMPSNNFVCPCKGFVPGLELQREDEELHSSCFQKEEVILDLSFFAKVEVLLLSEMGMIQGIFCEAGGRKIGIKMAAA